MSIKNIMVHLDQGPRTGLRLQLAVDLARTHDARLVGVFAQRGHAHQVGVVAQWPSPEYAAAAADSQTQFNEATAGLPNAAWQDLNRGSDAEVLRLLTEKARCFDLTILGQHDAVNTHIPAELAEHVVLHSGRPALVLPFAGEFSQIFDHPMIAWHSSPEAARAVNDALPLIADCKESLVVTISENFDRTGDPAADVMTHLACHGVKARSLHVVSEPKELGLMDALLNSLTDEGATLLVMGAQAPAGLPFGSRGGGTHYVFEHMTVPVLLSH
ncbi:MAG TPA: universal stress protein [Rhodocyclaceae bacterium]|nr:universal stress protein [Rhodocyclaceae bacterium]